MTRIADLLEQAVDASKEVKVLSAQRGDQAMAPTIAVYRGDQRVAIVVAGTEGRADILQAARMCIVGFGADVLVISHDIFAAKLLLNPLTGEEWGNGEMQMAADKHHGIERGWVSDAVSIMAVNRAGDIISRVLCYRKVSRHRVEWDEVIDLTRPPEGEEIRFGGVVADGLRKAMNEPTLMVRMHREGLKGADFGLDDPERVQAHHDLGVASVMHAHGITVAFSSIEGTVRDKVLKASANTKGI